MRPFRFFFGLSLAFVLFLFLARFLVMAFFLAAGLSLLFFVVRKLRQVFRPAYWEDYDYEYNSNLPEWDNESEPFFDKWNQPFERMPRERIIEIR